MEESSFVPENYQTLMPYLVLNHAQNFISFMEAVFGAKERMRVMRDEKLIMHAELVIGECTIMLSDSTPEYSVSSGSFFIYVPNADEAYKKALDLGASKVSDLVNQDYGRSGGILDPFQNIWWITSVL